MLQVTLMSREDWVLNPPTDPKSDAYARTPHPLTRYEHEKDKKGIRCECATVQERSRRQGDDAGKPNHAFFIGTPAQTPERPNCKFL